jgi:hypothetical protein
LYTGDVNRLHSEMLLIRGDLHKFECTLGARGTFNFILGEDFRVAVGHHAVLMVH